MKYSRELAVGGFTLLALLALASVTIYLRQWDLFNQRETYHVLFKSVDRLEPGAPVNVAGIQVGKVAKLEYYQHEWPVRVTIQIDRAITLYSNARVRVNTAEVIGDTTLEIDAGHPGEGVVPLPAGATLEGESSPNLSEVVAGVSEDLRATLRAANLILSDPENQASLKAIMANLSSATGRLDRTLAMINDEFRPLMDGLARTTEQLSAFLEEGRGLSTRVGSELSSTMRTLETSLAGVDASAQTIAGEVRAASAKLQQTLDALDRTLRTTDAALNENRDGLRRTIDQLEAAGRSLTELLARIERGEGTMGRLVTDPSPFDELRDLIRALNQTLTGRRPPAFPIPTPTPAASPTSRSLGTDRP